MSTSTFRGRLETPQTDLVVLEPATPRAEALTRARWPLATHLAFRFSFRYFGLYVICGQMLSHRMRLERKLYPNVDFYSGLIYQAMGIGPLPAGA